MEREAIQTKPKEGDLVIGETTCTRGPECWKA